MWCTSGNPLCVLPSVSSACYVRAGELLVVDELAGKSSQKMRAQKHNKDATLFALLRGVAQEIATGW